MRRTATLLSVLESADHPLPVKLSAAAKAIDARLEPAAMNRVVAALSTLSGTALEVADAATVSFLLGAALRTLAEEQPAYDRLADALGLMRDAPEVAMADYIVSSYTACALALGRSEEALRRLREVVPDEGPTAQMALGMARLLASSGRIDEAIAVLTETAQAGRSTRPETAELFRWCGILRERSGRSDAAVADFRTADAMMSDDVPPESRALTAASLSAALHNIGRWDEAAQVADRAIELARAGGAPDVLAAALLARANVCNGSGQTRLALRHYHQALLEHAKVGRRDQEVTLLNNIATCYLELRQVALSVTYLGWALDSATELDDRENKALALLNLSYASEPREARGLITQAWGIYAQLGDRQGQAVALRYLAQVLDRQGEQSDALHFLGMASDISSAMGDSSILATIHEEMGDLAARLGLPDAAWEHYERSWAAYEAVRRLTFAESVQLGLSEATRDCVAGAMSLALAMAENSRRAADARLWRSRLFAALERSRVRVLVDRLGSTPTAAAALPAEVGDRLADLAGQVRMRQRLLQSDRSAGDTEPERLRLLRQELQRAKEEFDEYEAFASQSFPTYRSFTSVESGDESDLDTRAGERVAVVEYAVVAGELISLVRHHGELSVHRHGDAADIASLDHELADVCWDSPDTNRITSLSRLLHTRLLEPVERAGVLSAATELIVVPTPEVFEFPVEALAGADGYVFERYAVSYLPSLSVSRFLRGLPDTFEPALIMANPDGTLPGAEDDVAALRRYVRHLAGGTAFIGEAATKAAFTQWAPTARLLHLAAHTDLQQDAPAFSGIVLAGGSPDGSGNLEVRDLLPVRLDSCLTVLSGCETGWGSVKGADEMIGFVRAFLASGSCAVLATRWPVRDRPTSLFMQAFYESLIDGG
ncbi:CHAT domain-containing tetratricopeptide repeat protein, partial [Streptomyces sp. NPDC049099]|uniref:CHAT domain-containing tetratricopeptide repeat protein n=1 Tax=Streptomyces sp. NPDC049099 TaxID=3155768 RepID=UPI0034216046